MQYAVFLSLDCDFVIYLRYYIDHTIVSSNLHCIYECILVPSSPVRNLTTSTEGLNATSIFVSWEVPIPNNLNGILVNYSISYFGIEIDTDLRVIYLPNPDLTNQSISLIDLEEYTTYSINVSAYTEVGRGPDAILTQRTNQDGEYTY